jgi:hypothetical protein
MTTEQKKAQTQKAYVVLSISDLTDMIAIIKNGSKKVSKANCGIFETEVNRDSAGRLQISSMGLVFGGRPAYR